MAGGREEREKRLAEALRANLRRRRQQLRQRGRAGPGQEPEQVEESRPPAGHEPPASQDMVFGQAGGKSDSASKPKPA